jgi:hypothetical protein
MKRFRKWRDDGVSAFITPDDRSMVGTPLGKRGEEFRAWMMDVDGFEPGADAYVYAIVLKRQKDETCWYYVGETTSGEVGLKSRIETHLNCNMRKPVPRDGVEVIDGALPESTDHSYVVIGVERAEPVSVEEEHHLAARAAERERQLAYELAIDKETTRILGGA